jgi:hypothetical protein
MSDAGFCFLSSMCLCVCVSVCLCVCVSVCLCASASQSPCVVLLLSAVCGALCQMPPGCQMSDTIYARDVRDASEGTGQKRGV